MNDDRRLERGIASLYAESAPSREPEGLLDDVLLRTSQARQRPVWLALIKEPPMRTDSRVSVGSPPIRVAAITLATLLAAIMLAAAGIAGARLLAADGVIVVAQDGSGDFSTLAEAVSDAADGDTIRIRPGTYDGALTIDTDLNLEGDGPADEIIITADDGYLLRVVDADTQLTGVTFRGPATNGVSISGGSAIIEGNRFEHVGVPFRVNPCPQPCFSLILSGGVEATVRDNAFVDGGQVRLGDGAAVTFEGNELTGGPHVAVFDVADGSVVRDNLIRGTVARGIGLFRATTVRIEGNTITDGGTDGITIGWDGSPGVEPLVVDNAISGSVTGVAVKAGTAPTLEGNTIDGTAFGLFIEGTGAAPILTGNSICGGEVPIDIGSGASMPDTAGNELCEGDAAG